MEIDSRYSKELVKGRDAFRDVEDTDRVSSCEICTRRWAGRPVSRR